MELRLLWLYHDIMDLYGDSGNIKVIKKRCEDRNIRFVLNTMGIGQNVDFNDYDLVFFGGGADAEQNIIYKDLLKRKDSIIDALNNDTFFLLICGGYQLFGQYYKDQDNNKIMGLGINDYYTVAKDNIRCIGNIYIKCQLDDEEIEVIGFENHAGQTENVNNPLGKVIKGYGNTIDSTYEGYYDGKCLGTYIHGPLLPKNPALADFVIKRALSKRYDNVYLEPQEDVFEKKAFSIMKNRLL